MRESTPPRGRPPSPAVRAAILDAAFAMLRDRGYAAMSIEAVASAAGAGKATVYRWWVGKAELVVDAFFHATRTELAFPDTGTAEGDFRSQIAELAALLRGPRGAALAAMLGAARTESALATALRTRWLEPRRRWGLERMQKAVAAGECRPGINVPAALSILYSPLYAPLLFGRDVPTEEEVEAYLTIACDGIFKKRR